MAAHQNMPRVRSLGCLGVWRWVARAELWTANWTLVSCAALYLLYAQLEEEWGLARHAMAVYDRATRAVEPAQQYDMFNIYIKRAAEIYGVTHTRGIYQKAIEVSAPETWYGVGLCADRRIPESLPV